MRETSFQRCKVYAAMAWTTSAALFVASWVLYLTPAASNQLAIHVGQSAVVVTGVAAVLQVRSYCVRIASVVRAAGGLEPPAAEGTGLRTVR